MTDHWPDRQTAPGQWEGDPAVPTRWQWARARGPKRPPRAWGPGRAAHPASSGRSQPRSGCSLDTARMDNVGPRMGHGTGCAAVLERFPAQSLSPRTLLSLRPGQVTPRQWLLTDPPPDPHGPVRWVLTPAPSMGESTMAKWSVPPGRGAALPRPEPNMCPASRGVPWQSTPSSRERLRRAPAPGPTESHLHSAQQVQGPAWGPDENFLAERPKAPSSRPQRAGQLPAPRVPSSLPPHQRQPPPLSAPGSGSGHSCSGLQSPQGKYKDIN